MFLVIPSYTSSSTCISIYGLVYTTCLAIYLYMYDGCNMPVIYVHLLCEYLSFGMPASQLPKVHESEYTALIRPDSVTVSAIVCSMSSPDLL